MHPQQRLWILLLATATAASAANSACALGMESGRISSKLISLQSLRLDTTTSMVRYRAGGPGIGDVLPNSTQVTIMLPTPQAVSHIRVQGGSIGAVLVFDHAALSTLAPGASVYAFHSTLDLTPLKGPRELGNYLGHTFAVDLPVVVAVRLTFYSTGAAALVGIELYADCLATLDFQDDNGTALTPQSSVALSDGKSFSTADSTIDAYTSSFWDTGRDFAGASGADPVFLRATSIADTANRIDALFPLGVISNEYYAVRAVITLIFDGLSGPYDSNSCERGKVAVYLTDGTVDSAPAVVLDGTVGRNLVTDTYSAIVPLSAGRSETDPVSLGVALHMASTTPCASTGGVYNLFFAWATGMTADCSLAGTYRTSAGEPCRACDGVAVYQDQIGQTACKAATMCAAGTEYETASLTPTSNRACATATVCAAGTEYEALSLTPTSNRACATTSVCAAGSYVADAATSTSDAVCIACDGVAVYQDQLGQTACKAATVCAAGTEYETAGLTSTSNRACATATVCAAGTEYETVSLTPTSDRACDTATLCAEGSFIKESATATSDTECTPCLLACSVTEYLDGLCQSDGTVDNACLACAPGYLTELQDGACVPCHASCNECFGWDASFCVRCFNPSASYGVPNDTADYTYLAGTACYSTCPNSFFGGLMYGNDITGLCHDVTTCAGYETVAPGRRNDRVCASKTSCAPGQYVATPGDASSDRTCAACAAGTYDTELSQHDGDVSTCALCTSAGCTDPGHVELTPCTATSDRVCGEPTTTTTTTTTDSASGLAASLSVILLGVMVSWLLL